MRVDNIFVYSHSQQYFTKIVNDLHSICDDAIEDVEFIKCNSKELLDFKNSNSQQRTFTFPTSKGKVKFTLIKGDKK